MAGEAKGDTPLGISVSEAGRSIVGLLDENMMVDPDRRTADEPTVRDDDEERVREELDGEDRGPDPEGDEGESDQRADDQKDSEHTDDDTPSKRKLKLPDGGEVDEDEAIKGYLRQSDYTKKTQATAEEKRKIEAELRPQIVKYAEKLKVLEETIRSMTPEEPDWNAERKRLRPDEFAAKVADWQLHEKRMVKLVEAREAAEKAAEQETAKEAEERGRQGYERLMELIPDWKDDAKGRAERQEILKYVEPLGLTVEHLKQAQSPELFVILRDAMRYRKLQAQVRGKPPVTQKVAEGPVMRPGSATASRPRAASEVGKAVQRAAQTGSVEDAGTAIRRMGLAG